MTTANEIRKEVQYKFQDGGHAHSHSYLLPTVTGIVNEVKPESLFDLGCGNGSVLSTFADKYRVAGIDASEVSTLDGAAETISSLIAADISNYETAE